MSETTKYTNEEVLMILHEFEYTCCRFYDFNEKFFHVLMARVEAKIDSVPKEAVQLVAEKAEKVNRISGDAITCTVSERTHRGITAMMLDTTRLMCATFADFPELVQLSHDFSTKTKGV